MAAYYNENDRNAAAWLRELIRAGAIAPGEVDERDIRDIRPCELTRFTQCHFFAGIGVWSYALRLAGWSDATPVWTGSCPCQPFSAAGRRAGFADERHLWPSWFHLVRECRPGVVLGEQIASKDGLAWLDLVHTDLEAEAYAFGPIDFCAAGVGAPHLRQRLYFVAYDHLAGQHRCGQPDGDASQSREPSPRRVDAGGRGPDGGMADDRSTGLEILGEQQARRECATAERSSKVSELGNSSSYRWEQWWSESDGRRIVSAWDDAAWLRCRDGKSRPVEPGTFPLAHGAPVRVGRLRGYGNAIVAPQAAAFIRAFCDCLLVD